ncbi:hypothetical protein J7355_13450 [Endozoicomonas sp. G2_2]|uniref:hypothetical protein n=1 Tax=Endozoicomonas sp. G2_2 TaxID=2821092 RepID=UPI001ADC6687|nr:hypothetical protein [Endozoicomonas sp. G2_2]MBO9471101.1 hypothetical protein [Endozoicomonas sp. G2_2]
MNTAEQDTSLLALLDSDIEAIETEIRDRVGIQRYARLRVIASLVHGLAAEAGFNRSDARTICPDVNIKSIDRALADMEAAGMVEILAKNDRRQRGGTVYRVRPAIDWQLRDPAVVCARALRSGRGRQHRAN